MNENVTVIRSAGGKYVVVVGDGYVEFVDLDATKELLKRGRAGVGIAPTNIDERLAARAENREIPPAVFSCNPMEPEELDAFFEPLTVHYIEDKFVLQYEGKLFQPTTLYVRAGDRAISFWLKPEHVTTYISTYYDSAQYRKGTT